MDDVGVRLVAENQAAFFGTMAKATAVGVAFGQAVYDIALKAGKAMIDFAASSITAASDLNETLSKSSVVFGDFNGSIVEMGKNAAESMGMSQNQAVGAAATYGNLFTSMGMGKLAARDMSMGLVQLAADLGSFNNIGTDEVLEKLRAGLTGETEPLKSLGVNISAVAVEEQALKMGLKQTNKELTASAKAQATYALILKQTKTAQGDFARTSGGLANQQKIFASNLENTKAALGTALLPVINLVMNALNGLFNNPKIQAAIKWLTDSIGAVGTFLSALFTDLTTEGGGMGVVFDDIKETLVNILPQPVFDAFMFFIDLIGQVIAFVQASWPSITAVFQQVADFVGGIMNRVGTIVQSVLASIQEWWAGNGAYIMATVQSTWAMIQGAFQAAGTFISTLISTVLTAIQNFWSEHGTQVLAVVTKLWGFVQGVFNTAISVVTSIFQGFTELLQGNWSGFTKKLGEAWDTIWKWITDTLSGAVEGIVTFIKEAIPKILNFFSTTDWGKVGTDIINGIWNGLRNAWDWLVQQVSNLLGQLLESVKKALGIASPSKVFEKIGMQISTGWGKGILEGAKIPIAATYQVAGMVGGAAMTAAPSTYNYSTSYNLNVMTSQSPAVVQNSFAMMRLLAG